MIMTKANLEKLKLDPARYQKYKQKRAKEAKLYVDRKKKDPSWIKTTKDRLKQRYLSVISDPVKHEELKQTYKRSWKESGYARHRRQVFRRLTKNVNAHYKDNLITPIMLWKIAKRQRLLCVFTGQKLTQDNMSVDHIIPKSKGGLNVESNIRLVIKPVNIARQNMSDTEFYNLCQNVSTFYGGKQCLTLTP